MTFIRQLLHEKMGSALGPGSHLRTVSSARLTYMPFSWNFFLRVGGECRPIYFFFIVNGAGFDPHIPMAAWSHCGDLWYTVRLPWAGFCFATKPQSPPIFEEYVRTGMLSPTAVSSWLHNNIVLDAIGPSNDRQLFRPPPNWHLWISTFTRAIGVHRTAVPIFAGYNGAYVPARCSHSQPFLDNARFPPNCSWIGPAWPINTCTTTSTSCRPSLCPVGMVSTSTPTLNFCAHGRLWNTFSSNETSLVISCKIRAMQIKNIS